MRHDYNKILNYVNQILIFYNRSHTFTSDRRTMQSILNVLFLSLL